MNKILVIDDDFAIQASLRLLLDENGFQTLCAGNPEEACNYMRKDSFDLILLDMNFSIETTGKEGLDLLKEIRIRDPAVPVILITAWGTIELAVEGMKGGASDFLCKPWSNRDLLASMETALQLSGPEDPARSVDRKELDGRYELSGIIGEDPAMLEILRTIGRVASTDASVLILGESGTGKEIIAEAIHRNSKRAGESFIKVNMAGIPSSLFESEMFGHIKGAFTDAVNNRTGRFQSADRGTIFLDEIGDVDPANQVKLLRVLQERSFEILGSSKTCMVDIRVISATNKELKHMVNNGSFREDLYYRINLISIIVPPLRERPGDIPLLTDHFLKILGNAYELNNIKIDDNAVAWLCSRSWPGNIRELRNLLERTVVLSSDSIITVDLLKAHSSDTETNRNNADSLPPVGEMTLNEMEGRMIRKTIMHFNGNISYAADSLGLSRSALYRRMEKYGIKA